MITYFLNWGKAGSRKKEFHDARVRVGTKMVQ
jgi:hypothetical protein